MKNRFGYEWSTFSEIIPLYETQFRAWTEPIALFDGLDVDDVSATWVNKGSWTVVARKKAASR